MSSTALYRWWTDTVAAAVAVATAAAVPSSAALPVTQDQTSLDEIHAVLGITRCVGHAG